MSNRRPLNKQVIVVFTDGGYSQLFRNYVSLVDIRDACTNESCTSSDEHYTFDGQVFFQRPNLNGEPS